MTEHPRLAVEQISARRWKLLEPLTWRGFAVPAGFVTDFASSPRWAWPIVPPTGRHAWPCVLHDWWYRGGKPWMTREEADALFLEALTDAGVTRWKRELMFLAVRVGGRNRGHWSR